MAPTPCVHNKLPFNYIVGHLAFNCLVFNATYAVTSRDIYIKRTRLCPPQRIFFVFAG